MNNEFNNQNIDNNIQQDPIVVPVKDPEPVAVPEPPKESNGGSKMFIVFIVVTLFIAGGIGAYTFLNKEEKEEPVVETPKEPEEPVVEEPQGYKKATLKDLSDKFNSMNVITEANKQKGYKISSSTNGDDFIITVSVTEAFIGNADDAGEHRFSGKLKGSTLTFNILDEDPVLDMYELYYNVLTAKAMYDGRSEEEARSMLDSIDFPEFEENGYDLEKDKDNTYIGSIDLSKEINIPNVKERYIEVIDLHVLDEIIETNTGNFEETIGELSYKFSINKKVEIIIFEKDELTDRTYKSILSFIEKLYGEEEMKNFKSQYQELVTKKFGKYDISTTIKESGPTDKHVGIKISISK